MNMPGFTAEASFDKMVEHYSMAVLLAQTEGAVQPQVGPEPGVDSDCFWDCYKTCHPPCVNVCLKTGG